MAAVGRVAPWVLSWRTVPLFRTPGRSKSEFPVDQRVNIKVQFAAWNETLVVVVVVLIYTISTRP